jgi:hypothetical protein
MPISEQKNEHTGVREPGGGLAQARPKSLAFYLDCL